MLIPRKLASMAKVCDSTGSRYCLNAVRVERDDKGAPHAIATDGRRLIHATWTEPELPDGVDDPYNGVPVDHVADFGALVPADAWQSAAKLAKPKARIFGRARDIAPYVCLAEPIANGTLTIGATDGQQSSTTVVQSAEGRFPKWRDVMPEYAPMPRGPFVDSFKVPEKTIDPVAYAIAEHRRKQKISLAEGFDDIDPADIDDEDISLAPLSVVLSNALADCLEFLRRGAVTITLDPSFVAECCKALADAVTSDERRGLDFVIPTDSGRAVRISGKSAEGISATAIIMPLARDR